MSDAFEPDDPATADPPISDAAVTTPHEGHEPAEEGLQALMAELHHRIAVAVAAERPHCQVPERAACVELGIHGSDDLPGCAVLVYKRPAGRSINLHA